MLANNLKIIGIFLHHGQIGYKPFYRHKKYTIKPRQPNNVASYNILFEAVKIMNFPEVCKYCLALQETNNLCYLRWFAVFKSHVTNETHL